MTLWHGRQVTMWIVVVGAVATGGAGWLSRDAAQGVDRQAAVVQRGEYLTQHVAMCVQCHTPRDEQHNLMRDSLFQGAPIPVTPPWPDTHWALRAPSIAGLVGFTDDQVIALLTTGQATGRPQPKSPMPPFRMRREDAVAVVAYLRTVAPAE